MKIEYEVPSIQIIKVDCAQTVMSNGEDIDLIVYEQDPDNFWQ